MSQLWKEGPEWLKLWTDPLPLRRTADAMPEECVQELRVAFKSLSLISAESRTTIADLMTCQNFSTYLRLLRVTAQVLRAVERFKAGKNRSPGDTTAITPRQLAQAEALWIVSAQQQFNNEKNFQQQQRRLGLFSDAEDYGGVEEGS